MSDVGRVQRDSGDGKKPKKKREAGSEEFRELMKVKKTREVDPEEKRKRKTREEAHEEVKTEQTQSSGDVQQTDEPSPYEPTKTTQQKTMGSEAPTTTSAQGESVSSAPPPSSEEPLPPPPTVESYQSEAPTAAPPPTAPASTTPDFSTFPESQGTVPVQQPQETEETDPTEQPQQTTETEGTPTTTSTDTGADSDTPEQEAGMKGMAEDVPGAAAPGTETQKGIDHALQKLSEGEKVEQQKATGEDAEVLGTQDTTAGLPKGSWEASKGTKEEEKPEEKISEVGKSQQAEAHIDLQLDASATPEVSEAKGAQGSAFANLPPHVMALFERMVGVMTVMHHAGVTETTINLSNPQFANSPFFGSEIVVREFATAPKEFNIEFLGNQQSADTFAGHTQEILASFQSGNYNFKVNRIDTSYLSETREVRQQKAKRVGRKQAGGGA